MSQTIETIAEPQRPRSWRKRLFIGGPLVLLLALLAALPYTVITSRNQLVDAIAEADRLDPGWRLEELESKRAVVPDEENSALVAAQAHTLIPWNWPIWEYPDASENKDRDPDELHAFAESLWAHTPARLDERQLTTLRREMERAKEAVQRARKLIDLPRGRFSITYAKELISTSLAQTQDTRSVAHLLELDALLRTPEGDLEGALASCRGILNTGRSIGDEPFVISTLVRIHIVHVTVRAVERTLGQGEPSEGVLAEMQHALESEEGEPLLLVALRGERGRSDRLMQLIETGDVKLTQAGASLSPFANGTRFWLWTLRFMIPGSVTANRSALLRLNNRIVEAARRPLPELRAAMKELENEERQLPSLAQSLSPACVHLTSAWCRQQALLRSAIAMLAAERYRKANGRWPGTLDDLVPSYLAEVPTDPYDGAALRLRRFPERIVIYSVSEDGIDNGGNLNNKDPWLQGVDLGCRLWNPDKRRQPPQGGK